MSGGAGESKFGTVPGDGSGTVKLSGEPVLGLSGLLGEAESGTVKLSGELELGLSGLLGEVESEGAGLLGEVLLGLVVPSGELVAGAFVLSLQRELY